MSESLSISSIKKDFSAELQGIVKQAQEIAASGQVEALEDALQLLLNFEKKCRINNDFNSLKEVCLAAVRLCYSNHGGNYSRLNATLLVLNKRRSQSKIAITAIVQEAMQYLETSPTIEVKMELIKTLITICEGKMYVEGESARLHLMLALIHESRGDVDAACDMIQDVHVETYGSLSKQEKAEYILQQIRLNLKKKDYIRTMIQSRKMNRKTIEAQGFTEIKRKYYTMMMEYYLTHEKNPWEICLCYFKIYESLCVTNTTTSTSSMTDETTTSTSSVLSGTTLEALEGCVIFLILSQFNVESNDMLHRLKLLKHTSKDSVGSNGIPGICYVLLQLFTTNEIIPQSFPGRQAVESHSTLSKFGTEYVGTFMELLNKRIIEHNLRVLSKSYTRIRLGRIAQLLDLDVTVVEDRLAEVATSGDIYVKINRPAGIVIFSKKQSSEEVLSDWGSDIGKLLHLMESTCHLIHRENMVHKI